MDKQEALQHLYKARLDILNIQKAIAELMKHESFDLLKVMFKEQRNLVIFNLRKEDKPEKIYRLQGRLSQIEDLFSLPDKLNLQLTDTEKRINELSKGQKKENAS